MAETFRRLYMRGLENVDDAYKKCTDLEKDLNGVKGFLYAKSIINDKGTYDIYLYFKKT